MKYLIATLALTLASCAHETTTMDRELALKLADRPTPEVKIIQAPPPVFNVNFNNSGGGQQQVASQPSIDTGDQPIEPTPLAERENCMNSPVYDMSGNLLSYQRHCFGSR